MAVWWSLKCADDATEYSLDRLLARLWNTAYNLKTTQAKGNSFTALFMYICQVFIKKGRKAKNKHMIQLKIKEQNCTENNRFKASVLNKQFDSSPSLQTHRKTSLYSHFFKRESYETCSVLISRQNVNTIKTMRLVFTTIKSVLYFAEMHFI